MGEGVDTMFHTLDRYLEEGYIEKYPNVIIYTPDHVLTYRIFAAVIYDDRHLFLRFRYHCNGFSGLWNPEVNPGKPVSGHPLHN